jgi:arsenate reductase (thioredoxin)
MGFKILFVGVGNTCRTPMAEAFARKLGLRAESAGTMPGTRVTPAASSVMLEKGIDLTSHRPKRLDFADLPDFDRIVIMGEGVLKTYPELSRQALDNWRIPDLLGQPLQAYRDVRDKLERRVHELVDELNEWQRI